MLSLSFFFFPLFILDLKYRNYNIMALPKRRHSRSRTGKRRAHDALKPPNIPSSDSGKKSEHRSEKFICPQCKQVKRPHTVCHNCGYYRGRQVIAVERA